MSEEYDPGKAVSPQGLSLLRQTALPPDRPAQTSCFGLWLSRKREERHLSVAEVAAQAGVSSAYLHRVQRGAAVPAPGTARRITDALRWLGADADESEGMLALGLPREHVYLLDGDVRRLAHLYHRWRDDTSLPSSAVRELVVAVGGLLEALAVPPETDR